MSHRRRGYRLILACLAACSLGFAFAGCGGKGSEAPRSARPAASTKAAHAAPALAVEVGREPVPQWIWGTSPAKDGEELYFRRTFDLKLPKDNAGKKVEASLWATCDNELTVWINGSDVLTSDDWNKPMVVDVGSSLRDGRNVIAVRAKNAEAVAGLIAKLEAMLPDGSMFSLVTDNSWRYATNPARNWRTLAFQDDEKLSHARVIARYGDGDWGALGSAETYVAGATPAEKLFLLPGFKAELLYSVPRKSEGSWVSMAPDPKGRIYVSDQSGPIFRVTPGPTAADTKVEKLELPIGQSQGMLWHNDSLYVVVNASGGQRANRPGANADAGTPMATSGLYRLRDTNGDDKLDQVTQLKPFLDRAGTGPASGEHGPHAVLPGADGMLYVVAGNFTHVPTDLAPTSAATRYAEDLLLKRDPDGRGHDPKIMAPGGWIARTDADGKKWELLTVGLRNTYDIAFNPDGELFGYDSDMEWDIGAPWYRPTRVFHAVSGHESGWRNGTGKWPTYYPDSVPPVVNTGLGSPTGVTFGTLAKFPAKYQHAFFVADWAYGRIYAVHMTPSGASYTGTYELFASGKPFGVTDVIVNPADGAMYVTTGGRNTQSGFYRITYVGKESTKRAAPPRDAKAAEARNLRHKLESFHGKQDPAAVGFAWQYLNHPDRFIRYAARVAVEFQDPGQWQSKALSPAPANTTIQSAIALCRTADKSLQPKVLESLDRLDVAKLTREQKLDLMRAYGLCFIRMGKPDAATLSRYAERWSPLFPSDDVDLDHELAQLLVYCDAPGVVTKCMDRLAKGKTQEEQLFYAFVLRLCKNGWTPEQRQAYFAWIKRAETEYTGGASFVLFIQNMRDQAVATLTPEEKAAVQPLLANASAVRATLPLKARPILKDYKMSDLTPLLSKATSGRSFEKGKAAFEATSCLQCHRFGKEGGATGPDITGAGSRFSPADVLEAIIEPSKVISDQYRDTQIVTRKNEVIVGQVQAEDDQQVTVRTNPLSPKMVTVKKADIAKQSPSRLSAMPEGLLNVLREDEILDLIAYVRSAGNPADPAFKK